jgi:transcriptional regulator with XRE-family HTH domain
MLTMTETGQRAAPSIERRLGALLRQRREQLGLTQEWVADAVGISQVSVGKIELGKTKSPRPQTLQRLAEVLGLDIADLYVALGRAADTYNGRRVADAALPESEADPFMDVLLREGRDLTAEGRAFVLEQMRIARRIYGDRDE